MIRNRQYHCGKEHRERRNSLGNCSVGEQKEENKNVEKEKEGEGERTRK